jgi:hypothetical protein
MRRFSLECERLASEVARQKPYIRDLERAAAAARTAQRQSDEAAALLQRQLGQMRQAQQQEVEGLAAELSKARHTVRCVVMSVAFDEVWCAFNCKLCLIALAGASTITPTTHFLIA